jgi:intein/homing endonuclease
LQPGDVVLTQNPLTGRLGLKPVLLATTRQPERLLAIDLDGNTIRATPGHPFWVVGKGWTLARHLEPGNRLHGLDGGGLVERIEEEAEPVRSFNLVVADDHTYFCGAARVLNRDNTDWKTDRLADGGLK